MGKIGVTSVITYSNQEGFNSMLRKQIAELQEMGYIIEVQYTSIQDAYSALIIGREKQN